MKGLWNVPLRNPFFTGREDILDLLHQHLKNGAAALSQPPAVSGLGGIGKTQTAIEYAHQYDDEYAAVFWVVAETEESVFSGFTAIARLLKLPEQADAEQIKAVAAVHQWLGQTTDWLLIFDNADNMPMVQKFVPQNHHGHIIYTTRASAPDRFAQRIAIEKFSHEDGADFLLKRVTGKEQPRDTPEWKDAYLISQKVDGLPLALDQAGAYVAENGISAREYLQLYKIEGVKLLKEYGSLGDADHASVFVTFSLAFEQVVALNPAASELLRFCAFLNPEDVPETLFTSNAHQLTGHLADAASQSKSWTELVGLVYKRSLLARDSTKQSLTIHRIVQDVLREEMSVDEQVSYVNSAVELLSEALPAIEVTNWPLCEQLLPHVLFIIQRAEELNISTLKIAALTNKIGTYLEVRARYAASEPLFERALKIREEQLGSDHPDTATSLNNLAGLYESQGRYEAAKPLYERALKISEEQLGSDHPSTATSLNNLASLYESQGRYEAAKSLYERALSIFEKRLGIDHPRTLVVRNNYQYLLSILQPPKN